MAWATRSTGPGVDVPDAGDCVHGRGRPGWLAAAAGAMLVIAAIHAVAKTPSNLTAP